MDDQNTAQNSIPAENPLLTSPPADASSGEARQEPTADAPILPMDSEPVEVLSEAPEASLEQATYFKQKIINYADIY